MNLHAIVLGATGATGRELVKYLIKNPKLTKISIFSRKEIGIDDEKLIKHIIDFSSLENYKNIIKGDILFSALGTTLKDAGSKENQFLVDYTYQYKFAKIAAENGVSNYSLVSAHGANSSSSFFYPKIKGELEESIKKLNFNTIHIFQPSFLIRQKDLIRSGEKVAISIVLFLNKFGLFKSMQPISVAFLATIMIDEALNERKEKITTYNLNDILSL